VYRFLIRRLLQMALTFVGATLIVYALMFANQTDPVQALAGERPVSPAQRAFLIEKYHLSEPFLVQYAYYMKGLLTGDFGQSLTGRSIGDMMASAWPVTMTAPMRMTPWMAFAPDISGVCSTEETFDTTSKPTKTASTKNVSSVVPSVMRGPPASRVG